MTFCRCLSLSFSSGHFPSWCVCVATGDILREARSPLVINYSDGFECVRLRTYLLKSIDFGRLCTEPTDNLWQSLNMIILTQLFMHFVFKSSLTFKNDMTYSAGWLANHNSLKALHCVFVFHFTQRFTVTNTSAVHSSSAGVSRPFLTVWKAPTKVNLGCGSKAVRHVFVQAGVCFFLCAFSAKSSPAGLKGGGVWPQACTQPARRVSLIEGALKEAVGGGARAAN